MRYSVGETDADGRYSADFVSSQSGVVLGGCTVELSIFRGDSTRNYLPPEFNSNPPKHEEFKLDITKKGQTFDYDIKYDVEIPPVAEDR